MKTYTIHEENQRKPMLALISDMIMRGLRGGPVVVELKRKSRSLSQNKKLWPMLQDVSKQVKWYDQHLTKEEWKDVFTAVLRAQKAVPGINGGIVMLGASTSKMNKAEFSELIESIYAFGAEHEVKWSEPALEIYQKYAA